MRSLRRLRGTAVTIAVLTAVPMAVVQARPLARAQNNSSQSFVTGTWDLTPVATSASPNTHSTFNLVATSSQIGTFALVNFGSLSVQAFTLTGSTSTSLRYCQNQAFRSGSSSTCADNSVAGTVQLAGATTLSSALAPAGYLTISETSKRTVNDTISVAVSQSQIVTHGTLNS